MTGREGVRAVYFILLSLMIASSTFGATEQVASICISKNAEEYKASEDELAKRWLSEQAAEGRIDEVSSKSNALNMYQLYRLAELYLKGEKYRDWAVGKKLLMESATLGNRLAIAKLGEFYLDIEKDEEKATAILACSADRGNPFAANVLGYYLTLKPGLDPERGLPYMKFAAENGLDLSVFNLARLHRIGLHMPKDEQMAVNLYVLLAQNGRSEACVVLGNMYESGWSGSPPNEDVALQWYIRAADLENALGSYNAGRLLVIKGELEEAKKYLAAAASGGVDDAKKLLNDTKVWRN